MNENNFLKEIGRSYIVSSLLPAGLFVPLGVILFYGFIPLTFEQRLNSISLLFGQNWVIFISLVFWVGFLLYSSFDWIIITFSGDWLPQKIKDHLKSRLFIKYKMYEGLKSYDEICEAVESNNKNIDASTLREKALAQLAEFGLRCPLPLRWETLAPTEFGNIFQSIELYIRSRYKIQGSIIWSRLVHLIPSQFLKSLEEKYNYLLFLVNSSLLLGLYGIVSVGIGLIRFPCQVVTKLDCHFITPRNFFERGFEKILPTEYIYIGVILIGLAYFIYRLSLNAAENYSLAICAGFDLYRRELLTKLGFIPGEMLDKEQTNWQVICEHILAGDSIGFEKMNYPIQEVKENTDSNAK